MSRRGITILDVIVLILIVGIVTIFFVATDQRSGESARKSRCASNLRQVGLYMQMYANEDARGRFPRTRYVPGAPPTAYTGADAAGPFGAGGPEANDVTAALWLLLRSSDIDPKLIACPEAGTPAGPLGDVRARSNFREKDGVSYALANPYPDDAAVKRGYRWGNDVDPEFILAADIGPSVVLVPGMTAKSPYLTLRSTNSPNHRADGQNVLFADGHVEFAQTQFVGSRGDPIYVTSRDGPAGTRVAVAESGSPIDALDTVCLPRWPDGRWYLWEDPRSPIPTHGTIIVYLFLLGVALMVVRVRVYGGDVFPRRRRKANASDVWSEAK